MLNLLIKQRTVAHPGTGSRLATNLENKTKDGVYFPASLLSFIPQPWNNDGTYSEASRPTDAVLLAGDEKQFYWKQNPPEGKQLSSEEYRLCWVNLPAPTKEESVSTASLKQKALLQDINNTTKIWQTLLTLGMITDVDKANLVIWMKYAQSVSSVDTSVAPGFTWPTKP